MFWTIRCFVWSEDPLVLLEYSTHLDTLITRYWPLAICFLVYFEFDGLLMK